MADDAHEHMDISLVLIHAELETIALLRAAIAHDSIRVNSIVTDLTCAAFTARDLAWTIAMDLREGRYEADSITQWLDRREISLRERELKLEPG